jgi:hypothetical protein
MTNKDLSIVASRSTWLLTSVNPALPTQGHRSANRIDMCGGNTSAVKPPKLVEDVAPVTIDG